MSEINNSDVSKGDSGDVKEVTESKADETVEIDSDLAAELDKSHEAYVTGEKTFSKGDVASGSLPACFDGLSEEKRAKQIEALGKMTPEEREEYLSIVEKEAAITADAQSIADKNGAELKGLENRVKTPSSTYEKMYDRGEPRKLGGMNDIIRYTEVYPADRLAEGTNASLDEYESRGYTVDRVKNTWDEENASYRGINATLTSPDGQKFEVQFHTQESYDLKNGELHKLYEERRTMADDDPRAVEIDEKMVELSSKLDRPDNINEVKNR